MVCSVKEIPSVRETVAEYNAAVFNVAEMASVFISGEKLRE